MCLEVYALSCQTRYPAIRERIYPTRWPIGDPESHRIDSFSACSASSRVCPPIEVPQCQSYLLVLVYRLFQK